MNGMYRIKEKQIFILCYFFSYLSFGIVMSNFTPFLSRLGYDAMERGILLSGYAITTIVFQLLFGILSDRYQTMKKIILLSLGIFALSSIFLFHQTTTFFALHLLLVALSGGLLNTLCGLYDTWVLGSSQELRIHLSFIKAFGSIGWAVGSVLASYLIMLLSYQGVAYAIALILLVCVANVWILPDVEKIERTQKTNIKDILQLMKNKQYMLLLLILFLLYSMVVANNCTVIDKMLALGATQQEVSLKWSLQSLLEIPTYMLGTRLLLRFPHVHLLRFSACMLVVQFLLFAFTKQVPIMILLSVFQLFSTPLLLITSKTLIHDLCPPHLRGSSQLFALSIFTGLSSLLIPTVAGSLSVWVGINVVLCAMSGFGILALCLLYRLQKLSN